MGVYSPIGLTYTPTLGSGGLCPEGVSDSHPVFGRVLPGPVWRCFSRMGGWGRSAISAVRTGRVLIKGLPDSSEPCPNNRDLVHQATPKTVARLYRKTPTGLETPLTFSTILADAAKATRVVRVSRADLGNQYPGTSLSFRVFDPNSRGGVVPEAAPVRSSRRARACVGQWTRTPPA